MDIKDLKVLVKMITETDITEFEMESGEERIFLKRGSEPQVVQYQAAPQQMFSAARMQLPHLLLLQHQLSRLQK